MSAPKRYFINKLCDFAGQSLDIPKESLKNNCMVYLQQIFHRQTHSSKDCDGGLYVGLAGVSYMCYYLAQHPEFSEQRQELLVKSQQGLNPVLSFINSTRFKAGRSDATAFLLGSPGVHAVAACVMKAMGNDDKSKEFLIRYVSVADLLMPVNFLKCGSDELFVGRAGYLSGILFLQKTFNQQVKYSLCILYYYILFVFNIMLRVNIFLNFKLFLRFCRRRKYLLYVKLFLNLEWITQEKKILLVLLCMHIMRLNI